MVFGHPDNAPEIALQVEGAGETFFPGDEIRATVTLITKKGVDAKKLTAGLLFHSRHQSASKSGKGDEETVSHKWVEKKDWLEEQELVGEVELARGLTNTYHIAWRIPEDATPSYSGDIIEHTYKLVATLERSDGKDDKEEKELQVAEPAPGEKLEPGNYGKGKNVEDATLQLALPKLEFVEGEVVTGKLLVEPHVDIEARSISLELWRVETVREGDAENVKEARVENHGLAGMTKLSSGESKSYDFSFPLNVQGCPTFKHGDVEGSWRLKAVISRPLAFDCEVEQEVALYAAYRQG